MIAVDVSAATLFMLVQDLAALLLSGLGLSFAENRINCLEDRLHSIALSSL